MSDQLPPRPDRETGEPRPPRAPVMSMGGWDAHRELDERRKPSPPQRGGPVLEWYRGTWRGGFVGAGGCAVVVGVFATVRGGGFDWVTDPWIWLIIGCVCLLAIWIGKGQRLAAGSDWLLVKSDWVDTYDLVEIEIVVDGWGYSLAVEDRAGRRVTISVSELQIDQRLWDLVYNGILHSAHSNDPKTNERARSWLHLPPYPPPTLEEREHKQRPRKTYAPRRSGPYRRHVGDDH